VRPIPLTAKPSYTAKCESCHKKDGAGVKAADGLTYQYPPLWGEHSYNIGAGLFRLSRFAGYVKNNMPQGVTWENPQLTDEEAWDVAAYVNAQQRPDRDLSARIGRTSRASRGPSVRPIRRQHSRSTTQVRSVRSDRGDRSHRQEVRNHERDPTPRRLLLRRAQRGTNGISRRHMLRSLGALGAGLTLGPTLAMGAMRRSTSTNL
jgi:cytochrome c553